MHPDDERVAAFLEGRLQGQERDEVMAHLAATVDDWEVFNDTAEILQEAEDQEGVPGAARRRSRALRAIRGEPLRALFTATATAMATAAARVRRWMDSGKGRN